MWPLASRLLGLEYTETLTLKNGSTFTADMSDIVGRTLLFYGEHLAYPWEPITTKFLEEIVRSAKTVFLAGGHIGYTAFCALNALPKNGHIYVFEPVSYLYNLSHINLSSSSKATVEHLALGEKAGKVPIHVDGVRSSLKDLPKLAGKPTEEVMVTSIDSYCKKNHIENVDVIFLDVEGFEYEALRGCLEQVLQQNVKPEIIFEVIRGHDSEKIYSLLKPFGYAFHTIESESRYANIHATTKKVL